MPCRIEFILENGETLVKEKRDYEGFHTRPARWETVLEKFERLSERHASPALRSRIAEKIANLESARMAGELTDLLAQVSRE